MSKVIDFNKRKEPHVHQRKEERADALRKRFEVARQEAAKNDPQAKAKATKRLLDLFKNPPPRKR